LPVVAGISRFKSIGLPPYAAYGTKKSKRLFSMSFTAYTYLCWEGNIVRLGIKQLKSTEKLFSY